MLLFCKKWKKEIEGEYVIYKCRIVETISKSEKLDLRKYNTVTRWGAERDIRMEYDYKIIRSNRKSLALEITREGDLLVRAPYRLSERTIRSFIEEKSGWIRKSRQKVLERQQQMNNEQGERKKLSPEEVRVLKEEAAQRCAERTAYYAGKMGVSYGRITIRMQKSRWGSCSKLGNLNFNCLLMLAPPEVLDYVVVHELCHRKEMNHSPRFWTLVEMVMPGYRKPKRWLKENGGRLMLLNGDYH